MEIDKLEDSEYAPCINRKSQIRLMLRRANTMSQLCILEKGDFKKFLVSPRSDVLLAMTLM